MCVMSAAIAACQLVSETHMCAAWPLVGTEDRVTEIIAAAVFIPGSRFYFSKDEVCSNEHFQVRTGTRDVPETWMLFMLSIAAVHTWPSVQDTSCLFKVSGGVPNGLRLKARIQKSGVLT